MALFAGFLAAGFMNKGDMNMERTDPDPIYVVRRLKDPIKIDGNWEKAAWLETEPVRISNYMGSVPAFQPGVQAKMLYDDSDVYVIFRVEDRYVRSAVQNYNGPVSHDACVEFFFSPDTSLADHYFNLETNAGGTPLLCHHIFLHKEYQPFTDADLDQLEIAHSLPKIVDPEITGAVVWTLEYRLPIRLLEKYGSVVRPKPGVFWRGNFYKTASQGSNPHYITWAKVENEKPNFHLPRFFGWLLFR
jgi:hypothetical protein